LKVTYQQNNFTAGEISPRIYGRTDFDRYANSLKACINAHPVVHGGCKRRGGFFFAKAAKFAAKKARTIEFVVSRDVAYMLEFGDLYVRIFSPNGVYLTEIVSPYTEAQLADIDYVQGADTMFLFNSGTFPKRLRRFSDTVWDLSSAPFTVQPFDEQGITPAASITLSALSGVITATASAAVFLPSDVGRSFISAAGIGQVTGFTSTTIVTVTTSVAFLGLALASGAWSMDLSPQTTCTASAVGPVGTSITLTLTASGWRNTFGTVDVGKYVRINGGLCLITGFTSDTIVSATVKSVLTSATGAPALSWSLESAVWSATNGYPVTGTIFEQRLWCAGTTKYPQTIWGSRTGLYYDFTKGALDTDACSFTIASDEVNPITYLVSARQLLVETYGGEMSMRGGNEKPITPSNVQIKPETTYGSINVRPINIAHEVVFVQRARRKVRAQGYQLQADGYGASDLTVLAEHITNSGVVAMAYQQSPDQLLWLVLTDGTMLSCTLDREQQVTGWARHYTEGAFESVACVPTSTGDQLWAVVRRTVSGATVRYIEYMDTDFKPIYPVAVDPLAYPPLATVAEYGCTVDAGILIDNVAGQTVFTGLAHLEGKTVDIVADGSAQPPMVVTGGQITLSRASYRTLIGTHFKTQIDLLTPEVAGGAGTAQSNAMSTSKLTMRFLNTIGAEVLDGDGNQQEVPFRQLGVGILGQPPKLYTGLISVGMIGWEKGKSEMSIIQNQPLPLHLQSAIRKLTINEG